MALAARTEPRLHQILRWQLNACMSARNDPANLQSDTILLSVVMLPIHRPSTNNSTAINDFAHTALIHAHIAL